MTLERFCKGRLVALRPTATAHQAARAMTDNHVGAVLVVDRKGLCGIVTDRDLALKIVGRKLPSRLPVSEVMTRDPVTVDVDDGVEQAAAMMHAMHVRRVVVLGGGRPKGIVTLDDLILARDVPRDRVREIVFGQLTDASPSKPEGFVRPTRLRRHAGDGAERSAQRRAQTLAAFLGRVKRATGLETNGTARKLFEVVAAALLRRLTPAEARDLLAQLPAALRESLSEAACGPDRTVTRRSIEREVERSLHVWPQRAAELVSRLGHAFGDFVSEGELDDVRGQLPAGLKPLLGRAA